MPLTPAKITIGGELPEGYAGEVAKHAVAAGFKVATSDATIVPPFFDSLYSDNAERCQDRIERALEEAIDEHKSVTLYGSEVRSNERAALVSYLHGLQTPFVMHVQDDGSYAPDPHLGKLVAYRPDIGRNRIETTPSSVTGAVLFDRYGLEDMADAPDVSTAKELLRKAADHENVFDPKTVPGMQLQEPAPGIIQ